MKDPLELAKEALDKAIQTEKRNQSLLASIGPAIIDSLRPVLDEILSTFKQTSSDIKQSISEIKIDSPEVNLPEIKLPDIHVPEVKVPEPKVTVNVPEIKIPEIKIPEIKVPPIKLPAFPKIPPFPKIPDIVMPEEMNIRGWVSLMGVDLNNPLPVQLRDAKGNPVNLFENLTSIVGGSGGGKHDYLTIKGFGSSAYSDYLNADNRLRVSVETGGSGLTDNELRATAVPISQVSGANWSVSVVDVFGSTAANVVNPDGRLKVELPTGASGLTDTELRTTAVPVSQVSGAMWSTNVASNFGTTFTDSSFVNSDNRLRVSVETGGSGLTDSELRASSVPVEQVSGSIWSTYVTGALNSLLVGYETGDNRIKVELPTGSSGLTDTELRATAVPVSQLSGARWSTEATQGTSPWVVSATDLDIRDLANASDSVSAYQVSGASWSTEATQSGSWSVSVTGSITSVVAVGSVVSDAVDDASAPVKTGGIARTANPTAVAGGDTVSFSADDIGRQINRPIQVRDLLQTAYVQLTNGTETTLLAGVASTFHDLVYIMGANASDAAVTVDIRAGTANGVVATLNIPASATQGVSMSVPIPQDVAANAWTADMGDVTGTTVSISALFSKEI